MPALAPVLKRRLDAGERLYSGWISTSEAANGAAMAAAGLDAVTVDLQHGVSDVAAMAEAIGAIAHAGAAPIARIPLFDAGLAGRALDSGAQGIIAPMINTPKDAEWLVKWVKFPPLGERSWGPARAMALYGMSAQAMLEAANDFVMTIPMIETGEAVANKDGIMATPGIDAVFVGPSDLSISLSNGERVDPGSAETLAACEDIAKAARRHGLPAAIFAMTPTLAKAYREMGYSLIVPGSDLMLLDAGCKAVLSEIEKT